MENIDSNVICAPEIARILKKTLATIHKYRKKGKLPEPKYKLNTVYVWDRKDFFVWLSGLENSKMNINDVSGYIGKNKEVVLNYRNIGLIPKPKNQKGELIWSRLEVIEHCERLIGLVTIKEIANETGYSESTILNKSKLTDFPKPQLTLKGCRLWNWMDVKKYMEEK